MCCIFVNTVALDEEYLTSKKQKLECSRVDSRLQMHSASVYFSEAMNIKDIVFIGWPLCRYNTAGRYSLYNNDRFKLFVLLLFTPLHFIEFFDF